MIAGFVLGAVFVGIFFFMWMPPCRHENTRYVAKCNDCGKIVGDIYI